MKPPLVEKAHDLPDCPYLQRSSLLLDVYPFRANSFSSPKVAVSARVVQAFLPFTHSQAIKVELMPTPVTPSLPNIVVLKLFDRRFVERDSSNPWSSEGELGLRQKTKELLHAGRRVMRANVPELFGLGTPEKKSTDVDPWINPQCLESDMSIFDWSEMKPWEREVIMYDTMLERLRREAEIYVHLSALQGIRIPRLYGVAQCVLESEPGEDLITRVPGLMLEYVDGKTLRELHVGENISEQEAERVSQDVLSSIRELQKHRVLHGDFRRANVVVRDADRTPFIIDFGNSHECTSDTEEEWRTYKSGLHELRDAREFLHEQGLHSPTPKVYHPDAFRGGFRVHNSNIERHDDRWRQKYVERLEVDGPTSEIRADEHGKTYEWEFARWRFKSGVKTHDENDE